MRRLKRCVRAGLGLDWQNGGEGGFRGAVTKVNCGGVPLFRAGSIEA
jgi:hypothetical protein